MALSEGLCTNCGSLMRIDDEKDVAICIFCWGQSNPEDAIALLENSDGYEYPNEEFEAPETEVMQSALKAQGMGNFNLTKTIEPKQTSTRKRNIEMAGKLTPKEKVALQDKPLVKPEVSKKHKWGIAIGVAVFAVALVLIAVPTYFLREPKANAIIGRIEEIVDITDVENRVDLTRQDNRVITIVSPDEVTEEDALTTFNNFASVYADEYGISEEDAKAKVEVLLLDHVSGGYRIIQEDGDINVDSAQRIIEEVEEIIP